MTIRQILTDNDKQLTDCLYGLRKYVAARKHEVKHLCAELDREHCIRLSMRPQTNGIVQQFNGRMKKEMLQSPHFYSDE